MEREDSKNSFIWMRNTYFPEKPENAGALMICRAAIGLYHGAILSFISKLFKY